VNISAHLSLAVVFCPFASNCLSNVLVHAFVQTSPAWAMASKDWKGGRQ
jgi:hypothetical protein